MIVDVFKNEEKYFGINKNFKTAFDFIKQNNLNLFNLGKHEILGDDIYLSIDEYDTKKESKPEYHKKYIDIQFLIKGEEKIGFCPLSEIKKDEFFDEKKDIGFGSGKVDYITMKNGLFIILFPQDAHQPCMAIDNPKKVKKVVIKVKIEQ